MPTPYALSSPEALFALLEEGIVICDSFRDGTIEMTIRKVSAEELELCVFSFRGSYRCLYADLQSYLERCRSDTQTRSIYLWRSLPRRVEQYLTNWVWLSIVRLFKI